MIIQCGYCKGMGCESCDYYGDFIVDHDVDDVNDVDDFVENGVIWPHQCRHANYTSGNGSDYRCLDCGYEWDDYSFD